MKKLLTGLFCLVALFALASCGSQEKEYKLGMGIVVNDHEAKAGTAQVDATVAAVVLENGKIVACRIDALQNKASITEGVLASKNTTSKAELGDAYGMASAVTWGDVNGDGKVLEWYAQAQAFEAHVVGMTAEEVAAMETATNSIGYQSSTDADLLAAGCTIQIGDFKDAVVKACKDEFATTFKAESFELGVAINGELEKDSKNATAEADGVANLYSEYAAVVVVDGKIVAALNDAVQAKQSFKFDGTIGELAYNGTKREVKEDYNMKTALTWGDVNKDGKVLEWYLQSAAFSAHVVGMTAEEVAAMETETNSIGYQSSTDADLLAAGCTIQITTMKTIVVDAINNAR